jgi:hypothetical protein
MKVTFPGQFVLLSQLDAKCSRLSEFLIYATLPEYSAHHFNEDQR